MIQLLAAGLGEEMLMLEIEYRELEKFIRVNHSDEDWNTFYDAVLKILSEDSEKFGERAIVLVANALYRQYYLLSSQGKNFPDIKETRIPDILDFILQVDKRSEELLMRFSHGFMHNEFFHSLSKWWHWRFKQKTNPPMTENLFAIGILEWQFFDAKDWISGRAIIDPFLDSPNAIVRACAAGALARMYIGKIPGQPPALELFAEIKDRDKQRPGVAIPFWLTIRLEFNFRSKEENLQFDELDWFLNIIEQRQSEEPKYSCYEFVDSLVCEIAANNVDALRRLFRADAQKLALGLASQFTEFGDDFREILVEMGNSTDSKYCSTGTYLLASNFGILHPEGEKRGFIKEYRMKDVRILWLENCNNTINSSAVIYPLNESMNDFQAWKWIDRLLPPEFRGLLVKTSSTKESVDFGDAYQGITMRGNVQKKIWNSVIIRKPIKKDWLQSAPRS